VLDAEVLLVFGRAILGRTLLLPPSLYVSTLLLERVFTYKDGESTP